MRAVRDLWNLPDELRRKATAHRQPIKSDEMPQQPPTEWLPQSVASVSESWIGGEQKPWFLAFFEHFAAGLCRGAGQFILNV
jgi:hypothetical protein